MNELLALKVGEFATVNGVKVRYDGDYDFIPGLDGKQYTLHSTWIDANGADRARGSFSLKGLIEIGVISNG